MVCLPCGFSPNQFLERVCSVLVVTRKKNVRFWCDSGFGGDIPLFFGFGGDF